MMATSLTGHEEFVVEHYQTLTEAFYRPLLGPDHLHLGYWPQSEAQRSTGLDEFKKRVPEALKGLVAETVAPAGIEPGDLVIDVGCGTGGTARLIATSYGCRVIGLDATPRHIELARDADQQIEPVPRSCIEYRIADATAPWDLPASSTTVVVAIESARHFRRQGAFLAEVAHTLRPGGRLVLTDWIRTEPMTAKEYADHLTPVCRAWAAWRLESLDSYCAKLRGHGLNVREAEDLGEHATPNAHLLRRLADDYAKRSQPALAEPLRWTARAWLEERMTIGRILAIK